MFNKNVLFSVGAGLLGLMASVLTEKGREEKVKALVDERLLELCDDDSEENDEEES